MGGYTIGVIGGDGIGPEVVQEALKVLAAAGVEVEAVPFDLGASAYLRTGDVLPDRILDQLRTLDAILLGAIGPPVGSTEVPAGLLERGLLLRLRFELDLYINLRPFKTPRGAATLGAAGMDLWVVRENTEGPYAGEGGALRRGTAHEVATQGSVNTRFGVERCIRYAFGLSADKGLSRVSLVHKTNVLTYAGSLWSRAFEEVGSEHPDIERDYCHVDAACIHLVERPDRFQVLVTDNLFGDILTDLAGALSGGIGLAASANLNPAGTGPSLFEPVHGAAHDIVGTGRANPLAAIRSAAMMMEHLGEAEVAARMTSAVEQVAADPAWGGRTTAELGDAVAGRLC
ncbi:MAG: 3-isopropylmalate dehydrogenase [Actinomycetota bacterium]|nr:3-isopropylmalate dehydrogenase [Actinomycetota bacterium]